VFQVAENAQILVEAIFHYRDADAYLLHEFVIMPDHVHLLLTPGREVSLEKCVQLIKGGSSFKIHKARGQKMEIWQVGFHDWTVRDAEDWLAKVEYIRLNPVKARLVGRADEWEYSSANGQYRLDPVPDKFANVSSGAKAHSTANVVTQGLKPLAVGASGNVGPKGPTPGGVGTENVGAEAPTPGTKLEGQV
jgi:putative transposase